MSRANVHELRDWAQAEFGGEGWEFAASNEGIHIDFLHGVNAAGALRLAFMLLDWAVTWTLYDESTAMTFGHIGTVIDDGRIALDEASA